MQPNQQNTKVQLCIKVAEYVNINTVATSKQNGTELQDKDEKKKRLLTTFCSILLFELRREEKPKITGAKMDALSESSNNNFLHNLYLLLVSVHNTSC